MSDRKHIEYCIRLGNTLMQSKLEEHETNKYVEPQINNNIVKEVQNNDFRQRLKNWNS